jgi:hypothetical protein
MGELVFVTSCLKKNGMIILYISKPKCALLCFSFFRVSLRTNYSEYKNIKLTHIFSFIQVKPRLILIFNILYYTSVGVILYWSTCDSTKKK